MKMTKKTDLRVRRTRKAIRDSFLLLIDSKGFNAITIQDIADEAMINRATFYLHYCDKYELLATLSDEVLTDLITSFNPSQHIKDRKVQMSHIHEHIVNGFRSVQRHEDFYKVMLGKNGIYDFNIKMYEAIRQKFIHEYDLMSLSDEDFHIPKDLLTHFVASAFRGVLTWWIQSEQRQTPEELAKQLAKIITTGPLQAAGFVFEDHS